MFTEASNSLKNGDYGKAHTLFGQLIEAYPDSSRARRGRAMCRIAMQDYAGAKDDIEHWIGNLGSRAQPDADAYFHLGECLKALGDEAGATAAWKTAVSINPIHTRALKALGRA